MKSKQVLIAFIIFCSVVSLVVLAQETEPPRWSDNSTNSTYAGEAVEFRLKWTDNSRLSGYIFSFVDAIGSFANDTWVPFYSRPTSYSNDSFGDSNVSNPTQAFDNDLYDNSTWATLIIGDIPQPNWIALYITFTDVPVNSNFFYTWEGDGNCGNNLLSAYDYSNSVWTTMDSGAPSSFWTKSFTISSDYVQDGTFQVMFFCVNIMQAGSLNISDVFIDTNGWSNVIKVVNSTEGATIKWKVYANDTSDNWNASEEFSFMTTDEAPQYSDNSTNSTLAGEPVEFNLRWTDRKGLSGYIFSFDNGTDNFNNDTWQLMTGTEDWSNVTKIINSTVGTTIKWKVYANDTSDNWNVSEEYSFMTTEYIAQLQWSNLRHEPSIVIENNSVDIKVEWSSNKGLNTVIIYENSTGTWEEHVCDLVTGICSGEILSDSSIVFFGIMSGFISLALIQVKKTGKRTKKLRIKFKTSLPFITVILAIFLISMLLFPEIPRDISRMLMRLGIIPMPPPQIFTHTIPETNLDLGEVVGYYSYANDTFGNDNTTENRTFTVGEGITSYLMAYWAFDEGSGNITYDSSDYGNNGTIYGATWTTDCKSGSCLNFDGVDDNITVPNSPSLAFDYDTFTILVWVKTSDNDRAFFDKYDWNVIIAVWDNYANFYMVDDVGNWFDMYGTTNISDEQWHHIAAVRDKPNNIVRLYLDGVEEANTTDMITVIDTTGDIYIGSDTWDYFNGTIDEIKIYNMALTAEEIMNEYESGIPVTTSSTTIPPTFSGNQTNETRSGKPCEFTLTWDDDKALHPFGQYIFATNNSGTWANASSINFTSTPQTVTNITTLNDTEGFVQWMYYASDNSSKWNVSDTYEVYVVTTVPCELHEVNITPECDSDCEPGERIIVNATYSGDCPDFAHLGDPVYIQVNANSTDCYICDQDRDVCDEDLCNMTGITVECSESPCSVGWTIPATVPEECQGDTVNSTYSSLNSDFPCRADSENKDEVTPTGSFTLYLTTTVPATTTSPGGNGNGNGNGGNVTTSSTTTVVTTTSPQITTTPWEFTTTLPSEEGKGFSTYWLILIVIIVAAVGVFVWFKFFRTVTGEEDKFEALKRKWSRR